ncbi:two-component response regulator ssk1p [Niveomyces insectorum RCEF 264]|uniref:Two-component response regulator ssk1p n=1 Tax=Niveomyces insectorum RCEF 264 TaxID=1081102 RepID=A0A162J4C2_9HYPO|nr:two-component response regulator ssk1p [Niveomyces insectorum RCEF 264]
MASSTARKVWVRRPGASATLVPFNTTDVVDDLREMLLRKYGNSLGRVYDAPDIVVRLIPREAQDGERVLDPDELMVRTLDVYYPGGQTIDEALIIDVPPPPRHLSPYVSPRGGPPHAVHLSSAETAAAAATSAPAAPAYHDGYSAGGGGDQGTDYFGPGANPEYYSQGTPTAGSDYAGATLATEAAYSRPASAAHQQQHHTQYYSPSAGYQHNSSSHAQHYGHQPQRNHSGVHLRTPPGGAGASAGGPAGVSGTSPLHHPHSMSIIATGQAPPLPTLPSPGTGSRRTHKSERPKLPRQISGAPDVDGSGNNHHDLSTKMAGLDMGASSASDYANTLSPAQRGTGFPKMSMTAPVSNSVGKVGVGGGMGGMGVMDGNVGHVDGMMMGAVSNGMPNGSHATALRNGVSPPRPMSPFRAKKPKKGTRAATNNGGALSNEQGAAHEAQLGMLTVPPINVLIVEDNIINLKLLEAFVKRLKVRWQTAMNGRDAVLKWRSGGFHLVLMDIQLPLMSGLEATREIRRLERVNSIGVFASTPSDSVGVGRDPRSDKLENMSLFKSPVIIVALTASSLQSDRNDALAAGCNDFLTKPVNFVWLEKKIMEWGCMQALIDFDGWRKWKELKLPAAPPQQQQLQQQHQQLQYQQQQQHAMDISSGSSGSSGSSAFSGISGGSGGVGGGDASSMTKRAKRHSGHAKRPSAASLGQDTDRSSDTLGTVSSGELSGTGPNRAYGLRSGPGSGSNARHSPSAVRSPLSQGGRPVYLAGNGHHTDSASSPDELARSTTASGSNDTAAAI